MTQRLRSALKPLVTALPLALGWTIYTAQPTPGNFLLGYGFSLLVMTATGLRGDSLRMRSAPRQLFNLAAYIVYMAYEILAAGLNISRIILSPNLSIDPGLTEVYTRDSSESELISAISAHGITITPGELVVDFEETTDTGVKMIVHSLNHDSSAQDLEADQAVRLKRIQGILGHD